MSVSSSSTVCEDDRSYSACLDIACGVLQGSVLPKMIFKLYKDICKVTKLLKSILFADNTNNFCYGEKKNTWT